MKTVVWFSAGVSSAVSTKLVIGEVDEIIYIHIDDQHEDTLRFVHDCEEWFGKSITVLQSTLYRTVEQAILSNGKYINGPNGAPCTNILKKRVRKDWESWQTDELVYVWGMDINEKDRCGRLERAMPKQFHRFPLIEQGLNKKAAHALLKKVGVPRPVMYDLGYHNNNCIGCVKGGAGYWNRIRVDFPEVFTARAAMERLLGCTCLKRDRPDKSKPAGVGNSVRLYLDELDPKAGLKQGPICQPCGVMCQLALDSMGE